MPGVSFIGHLCGVVSGFLFASGYLNWLVPMHCLVRVEKGCFGSMLKKSDAFVGVDEALEFRSIFQSFIKLWGPVYLLEP